MKGTHEFLTIKQSLEASMEAMRTLLGKVQSEVDTLEQQKAVLAVEVQNITRGLEPARKEAAGQQAEVEKAYERSRQARVEADAEIAKIKADVEHWEKKNGLSPLVAKNNGNRRLQAILKRLLTPTVDIQKLCFFPISSSSQAQGLT